MLLKISLILCFLISLSMGLNENIQKVSINNQVESYTYSKDAGYTSGQSKDLDFTGGTTGPVNIDNNSRNTQNEVESYTYSKDAGYTSGQSTPLNPASTTGPENNPNVSINNQVESYTYSKDAGYTSGQSLPSNPTSTAGNGITIYH
ncbi:hypothetical protein RB653_004154 [Dictyostelium firmibasis]|uniref:Uncharacterized protein n=1 Tax=Dictyostelium firmibasis TaxID=79012 RepID=A0AAN7TZ55_9MYCE